MRVRDERRWKPTALGGLLSGTIQEGFSDPSASHYPAFGLTAPLTPGIWPGVTVHALSQVLWRWRLCLLGVAWTGSISEHACSRLEALSGPQRTCRTPPVRDRERGDDTCHHAQHRRVLTGAVDEYCRPVLLILGPVATPSPASL